MHVIVTVTVSLVY